MATEADNVETAKTVIIAGALDTKGAEFGFVKSELVRRGLKVLVVDFGILGEPAFPPDISSAEVAAAAGGDLARLRSGEHKDEAMKTMAEGLATVVRRLFDQGRLDGVIGMGGTGGTSVATAAMRSLPVGVPKVMVSTVGGGDVGSYAGTKDITFLPSVVDVAGFNPVSRRIYLNAAGAIAGMVQADVPPAGHDKPLIGATMFGNTTPAVNRTRERIEAAGYEVLVFHATGVGGRTMEDLARDNYFRGVLDLTTTELADEVCGGVMSAGALRGRAAPTLGLPVVLAPGCVDMANFGSPETVPERYRDRVLYEWNPNVTLLRTNVEENRRIGRMLAEAANAATGPLAILLPLKGVSQLDSPGGPFWDPAADDACYDAIRSNLKPGVEISELDYNINDQEFADHAAEILLSMIDSVPSP
jgi:uncharacterized protein (UPF0261 family)